MRGFLVSGMLGFTLMWCSCAPSPSQPAVVHVSAGATATAERPRLVETPFVAVPGLETSQFWEVVAPGRVLIGVQAGLVEVDGARMRQLSRSDENPLGAGVAEHPYGCGVDATGALFLLTSESLAIGPPWHGHSRLYRLVSRTWIKESEPGMYDRGFGVKAWSKGRWLLLQQAGFTPSVKFETSGSGPDLPRLTAASFDPEASAIEPADFAALTTGEVVVVGRLRQQTDPPVTLPDPGEKVHPSIEDPEYQRGAWERFAPGSTKGVIEPLTWQGADLFPCCVKLRSPEEVWIAGFTSRNHGFVGKWDGRSWSFAHVDEPVSEFGVEPDGTAWVATRTSRRSNTKVKRGKLGEDFETVPLPKLEGADRAPTIEALFVAGAGDVWLQLYAPGRSGMYRTRPTSPLEELPVSDAEKAVRWARPTPFSLMDPEPTYEYKDCHGLFVIIDEDVPFAEKPHYSPVAAALKGHSGLERAWFIEYSHKGSLHFGARVPDVKTGKKLVAALAKAVKPKPRLTCFEPAATRKIVFDLESGMVVSAGAP